MTLINPILLTNSIHTVEYNLAFSATRYKYSLAAIHGRYYSKSSQCHTALMFAELPN